MKAKQYKEQILLERLVTARDTAGYNMKEAAKELGFNNYQTLSDIEKGKRTINAHELIAMAKLYSRTLDYFLDQNIAPDPIPLWRKSIEAKEKDIKSTQREFLSFLEHYHNLEHLLSLKRRWIDLQVRHSKEDFVHNGFALAQKLGWGLVLAAETLPWGLRLAPFRPDHLAIVVFLPASILAAAGLIKAADYLHRRAPVLRARFFFVGLALGCCLVGLWQTRTIVNPATVFATSDDRQAAEWAAHNTPADAVFLINVVPWQSGLYRGVDGGWWLEPLAERRTLLPPMVYSFGPKDYVDEVDGLAGTVSKLTGCSLEFWSVVRSQGVTYLYITEGTGSLQPDGLAGCSGIEEVFRIGRVRIYRVTPMN